MSSFYALAASLMGPTLCPAGATWIPYRPLIFSLSLRSVPFPFFRADVPFFINDGNTQLELRRPCRMCRPLLSPTPLPFLPFPFFPFLFARPIAVK
jgi:hypothetical protein